MPLEVDGVNPNPPEPSEDMLAELNTLCSRAMDYIGINSISAEMKAHPRFLAVMQMCGNFI